jgi:hypothetical protein
MKKLALCLMTALFMLAIAPNYLSAGTTKEKITITTGKPVDSPEANKLIARINEIKDMDINALSSVQKRELRQEVRSIKGQLRETDGGYIYISAAGLVVIILLIIILL